MDERLSWPGLLTYSGRFTHISGHPLTTGPAQDRKSSPAKDRRSPAVPRNHDLPGAAYDMASIHFGPKLRRTAILVNIGN